MEKLVVGIGDSLVSKNEDDEIKTYALGSCVALIILDPAIRAAGMCHIALPESSVNPEKAKEKPAYFADTGVTYLLNQLKEIGSKSTKDYIVKLIGGANVIKDQDKFDIGKRNVTAIQRILWKLNIPVKSKDIGGDYSRTVTINLKNGQVVVSSATGDKWTV